MQTQKLQQTRNGQKTILQRPLQILGNQLKKDDERGMMPKNKRNRKWFWAYAGSSFGGGQGKRVGHMVRGDLTGIPVANFNIEEATAANLDKHFKNVEVFVAIFGDGTRLSKEMYENHGINCIKL